MGKLDKVEKRHCDTIKKYTRIMLIQLIKQPVVTKKSEKAMTINLKQRIYKTLTMLMVGCLLSGCSYLPKQYQPIRNNRNAYLQSQPQAKLKVPASAHSWQFKPEFEVPHLPKQAAKKPMPPKSLKPPYLLAEHS